MPPSKVMTLMLPCGTPVSEAMSTVLDCQATVMVAEGDPWVTTTVMDLSGRVLP